jgi:hypothetical protein
LVCIGKQLPGKAFFKELDQVIADDLTGCFIQTG